MSTTLWVGAAAHFNFKNQARLKDISYLGIKIHFILTCLFLLQLAIIQLQQIVGKYLLTSDVSLANPWKLRHFENWLQKHLKLGRHFVTWPLTLSNIWWFCVGENLIKFLKKRISQHFLARDSFLNQTFWRSKYTKKWWKSNLFGYLCLNFAVTVTILHKTQNDRKARSYCNFSKNRVINVNKRFNIVANLVYFEKIWLFLALLRCNIAALQIFFSRLPWYCQLVKKWRIFVYFVPSGKFLIIITQPKICLCVFCAVRNSFETDASSKGYLGRGKVGRGI